MVPWLCVLLCVPGALGRGHLSWYLRLTSAVGRCQWQDKVGQGSPVWTKPWAKQYDFEMGAASSGSRTRWPLKLLSILNDCKISVIKWSFPSYILWFGGFPSIKSYVENSASLSNPFLVALYNYCLHDSMRQWLSQSNSMLQQKNASFLSQMLSLMGRGEDT